MMMMMMSVCYRRPDNYKRRGFVSSPSLDLPCLVCLTPYSVRCNGRGLRDVPSELLQTGPGNFSCS